MSCGGESRQEPPVADGDRVTLSLAVVDSVGYRTALHAIDQGIVTSDSIDVTITYLSPSAMAETARSKQYDVVDVPTIAVPLGAAEDFEFVVISSGLQDIDGTLLFVSTFSDVASPADLAGRKLGVVSREDPSTLETRVVLQRRYGLDASLEAPDVTIEEVPPASLATMLEAGSLDAAVLPPTSAYELADDDGFLVLTSISAEARELTGDPAVRSLLVTYPDIARERAQALAELKRLLAGSVAHFKANAADVVEAIAAESGTEQEFITWWWERFDLPLGELSPGTQKQVLDVWEAARFLGDIEEYPSLATVVFNPAATPSPEPGASVP